MPQVEEAYIGAEEFCARVRQEEASVLRAEPALLQALRFDLITYSPFRALAGFVMVRHLLVTLVQQRSLGRLQ